ncbi:hypothetical protein EJB05_26200, partial [Eragrostis curvula]
MDDGADPNATAGRPPTRRSRSAWRTAAGPFIPGGSEPSHESLGEPSSRFRRRLPALPWRALFTGEILRATSEAIFGSGSQASSSTAPPSDHPGAQRTRSGTRGRRSRRRRSMTIQHVEHPSEVGSSELEITNLPRVEEGLKAPSSSDSPGFHSDHSGVGGDVTGTRIRQSVLYSNRPRRPRPRPVPSPSQEHSSEVSNSELDVAAPDFPALEGLSLSDPQLVTPQTYEETDDDDDAYIHGGGAAPHEPIEFGIGTFGPQTLRYSAARRPQFKWSEGIKERGQGMFEELAADTSEVLSENDSSCSPKSNEKYPTKDSDYDTEEELRLIREYRAAANTCTSFKQAFDELLAEQHAARAELAAKRGTEPPLPLQAELLPVDQESQSVQAQQQSCSAAAQPHHGTASRKPRCEASNTELIENAEKWMCEEGLDCQFTELCHQCFNVENYNKIFHHYNFKARIKKPNSVGWLDALYFAEVKQMFGRKFYFCCRLEPNENGHCYACKSQSVEELQHPATGGYETGLPNVGFGLWYE